MTKAKTVGKRRAGRKRKRGEGIAAHTPRATRRESEDEATATVAQCRCRQFGLEPTPANLRKVLGGDYGTFIGRLYLMGKITEAEKIAAGEMAELVTAYKRIYGLPGETISAAKYGEVTGPGGEECPETLESLLRRHRAYSDAFNRLGVLPKRVLYDVAVRDVAFDPQHSPRLNSLKIGLRAMVEHFGVGERGPPPG